MTERGQDLFKAFRPCYIRAFKDAADYATDDGEKIAGTKNATQNDFVDKSEFRLFCVYVIVYAAMFDAFSKIDGGGAGRDAGDDKRIELDEFLKGYKAVTGYGFVALENIKGKKDAKSMFSEIDDNGGGIVLLDEWCWFIKQAEVKADTEVGRLLAADEEGGVGKPEKLVAGKAKVLGKSSSGVGTPKAKSKSPGTPKAKKSAGMDAGTRKLMEAKMSGLKKADAGKPFLSLDTVKEMFRQACASSGVGKDKAELKQEAFVVLLKKMLIESKMYDTPTDRDFRFAFDLADENKSGTVDEVEFLKLNRLVLDGRFKELGKRGVFGRAERAQQKEDFKEAFKNMDTTALTSILSPEEEEKLANKFKAAAKASNGILSQKGFQILIKKVIMEETKLAGPSATELDEAFDLADTDKNGTIDKGEFVAIVGVYLGKIRDQKEKARQERLQEKAKKEEQKKAELEAKKKLVSKTKGTPKAADSNPKTKKSQEELIETLVKNAKERERPEQATANSFGLAVGKSASKDFFDFQSVFEPLCADNKEGEKLRDEGFLAADPNGNGLCSLAELETFVLKSLLGKFPNSGKGKEFKTPGKDIWTAFRPCYVRAFKDAADYAKDDGETIKGTKNAKQDDFVSKEEFRHFCVYAIVYAAMFDAFAAIDGGGSGRDAGDDKRIELDEWLRAYKGVANHGFFGLEGIEDKKQAAFVFSAMDDNGGGIVLLDEWCWFIKQIEVKMGTPVGLLLAADEAGGVGKPEKLAAGKAKVLGRAGRASKGSFV